MNHFRPTTCFAIAVTLSLIVGVAAAGPAGAAAKWTVVSSPNVTTTSDNAFSAVACPSASNCFAVGNSGYASGVKTMAQHWNGSRWGIQSIPNPSSYAFLSGIACPIATSCVAVGTYTSLALSKVLLERWNGTRWGIMTDPALTATGAALAAVACPSASSCFAVGSVTTSSTKTLAEHWNGSSWHVMTSISPATSAELGAITCPSTTSCFAVGNAGATSKTLVEHWNGSIWHVLSSPNPASATAANLSAVRCPSATNCFAVGTYTTSTAVLSLAEHWNGSRWGIQPIPNPTGSTSAAPVSLSCPSTTSCFAAGFWRHSISTPSNSLVQHWNGSSWHLMTSPSPGTSFSHLWGVACTSTTNCIATGGVGGALSKTLVERYA